MAGVLVTGGAGRLGQLVVHELANDGLRLVSLDKVPWRGTKRPDVTELVGDLLEPDVAREAMDGVDVVVHLAAELLPGPSCLRINHVSTWNVLSAAVDRGVRRVVYASSVYAFGHHRGFTREQYPDGFEPFEDEDVLDVGPFPSRRTPRRPRGIPTACRSC